MEKGIDIHNYDKLLVSTLRRMKESNISEKNKKIIKLNISNIFNINPHFCLYNG